MYCLNNCVLPHSGSKNSRAFLFAAQHLLVLSEERPYVICSHSFVFKHSRPPCANLRAGSLTVCRGLLLSAPLFLWTVFGLCLGDCPLQAGWWQHSTMIERPETAVPSIAVSPFLLKLWEHDAVGMFAMGLCFLWRSADYLLFTRSLFERLISCLFCSLVAWNEEPFTTTLFMGFSSTTTLFMGFSSFVLMQQNGDLLCM